MLSWVWPNDHGSLISYEALDPLRGEHDPPVSSHVVRSTDLVRVQITLDYCQIVGHANSFRDALAVSEPRSLDHSRFRDAATGTAFGQQPHENAAYVRLGSPSLASGTEL